jgi:hypothetical protein
MNTSVVVVGRVIRRKPAGEIGRGERRGGTAGTKAGRDEERDGFGSQGRERSPRQRASVGARAHGAVGA